MALSLLLAVVVGRGIRPADERSARPWALEVETVCRRPVRPRCRRIPLPPVGVALAASAAAPETVGYVGTFTGAIRSTGPLSMDAPFSLPLVSSLPRLAGRRPCP